MAELWAKIIRLPSTKSIKIIGVSHHHLRCQKNSSNSPAMPNRLAKLSIKRIRVTSFWLGPRTDDRSSRPEVFLDTCLYNSFFHRSQ